MFPTSIGSLPPPDPGNLPPREKDTHEDERWGVQTEFHMNSDSPKSTECKEIFHCKICCEGRRTSIPVSKNYSHPEIMKSLIARKVLSF